MYASFCNMHKCITFCLRLFFQFVSLIPVLLCNCLLMYFCLLFSFCFIFTFFSLLFFCFVTYVCKSPNHGGNKDIYINLKILQGRPHEASWNQFLYTNGQSYTYLLSDINIAKHTFINFQLLTLKKTPCWEPFNTVTEFWTLLGGWPL